MNMRVRIIKSTKKHRVGEILEVSRNVAFGLLDSGVAVISKDLISVDYKTKTRSKK